MLSLTEDKGWWKTTAPVDVVPIPFFPRLFVKLKKELKIELFRSHHITLSLFIFFVIVFGPKPGYRHQYMASTCFSIPSWFSGSVLPISSRMRAISNFACRLIERISFSKMKICHKLVEMSIWCQIFAKYNSTFLRICFNCFLLMLHFIMMCTHLRCCSNVVVLCAKLWSRRDIQ